MIDMKNELLVLQNMNCPACAAKAEDAVRKLTGVHAVRVAFASGTMRVQYDETVVSHRDIEKVLRGFGLGVTSVLSTGGAV
jgi:copper chaperone CopZ